jgi:hypothetical protein
MACYDATKQWVASTGVFPKGSSVTILTSATIAGFFMTMTVAPFDMVWGWAWCAYAPPLYMRHLEKKN